MEAKYKNGQKIKIIEVKNQHGHLKYPELQEHINDTGEIEDSYIIPMQAIPKNSFKIENYPIYKVSLDKGIILDAVVEDALEALD